MKIGPPAHKKGRQNGKPREKEGEGRGINWGRAIVQGYKVLATCNNFIKII